LQIAERPVSESAEKISRVRAYLKQHKLDGVVFATRANFAWLSGGGDNHVVSQTEGGVGALVVTAKQAWVIANRIEIDRLKSEEPLTAFTTKTFPWIESMKSALADVLPKGKYASDDASTGLAGLPGDFVNDVRAQLSEAEIRRYKGLGRDCALVIETVARNLQVGDSEHQAEADLARHLLARGIQPYVVLVAYDERIVKHRHPTPTAKHLRKHAMLVVCGQRHGLIANITRFVHFGAVSPDLLKRHEAVCRVETAFWEGTVTGKTWGDAFAAGLAQYKKEGFAKEWELHHQGGPTGYAGRDIIVTPGEKRKVLDRVAVAWNPSITGTKTEDTFILENGVRTVITSGSDHWPTLTVKSPSGASIVRPSILVR
jgi:Xaa-Pro dipeptidase